MMSWSDGVDAVNRLLPPSRRFPSLSERLGIPKPVDDASNSSENGDTPEATDTNEHKGTVSHNPLNDTASPTNENVGKED